MKKSLIESFQIFTKESKNIKCRACKLPAEVLDAVNTLLLEGQARPAISRWLISLGHRDVTQSVLIAHHANHVESNEDEKITT